MTESGFFEAVAHTLVPWLGYHLHVPVFYFDYRYMNMTFTAPLDKIRALLPSSRIFPYQVMPGRALAAISAYEYMETDLGPYNEVIFSIPVSLDRPLPVFSGTLRKTPSTTITFIHTIAVTTEIACKVGQEFAGYPKFLAQIEFEDQESWTTCKLALNGALILSIKGRKISGTHAPRSRINPVNLKNGYLLRSELVMSEREVGTSRRKTDAELILENHPAIEPIKDLGLKTAASYSYCPSAQAILAPVFESLKA